MESGISSSMCWYVSVTLMHWRCVTTLWYSILCPITSWSSILSESSVSVKHSTNSQACNSTSWGTSLRSACRFSSLASLKICWYNCPCSHVRTAQRGPLLLELCQLVQLNSSSDSLQMSHLKSCATSGPTTGTQSIITRLSFWKLMQLLLVLLIYRSCILACYPTTPLGWTGTNLRSTCWRWSSRNKVYDRLISSITYTTHFSFILLNIKNGKFILYVLKY